MNHPTLIILDLVIILVVLVFAVQALTLAWVKRKARRAIQNRYSPQDILMYSLTANFFGQTSRGYSQIRGNGALVLTRNELWFALALPRNEITIPLQSIITTSIEKSHLKKTKMRPLLHIKFNSLSGIDSVAWLVEDPEEWQETIEKVRSHG